MKGFLGDLFDLNHDGEIDIFERAAEFSFLEEIIDTEEDENSDFELSGVDLDAMEYMDPDERREALEEAGLDPDDYDF